MTRAARVTLPAFAKINLGLTVLGAREDGFHELRTVFQTISLHDTLRFDRTAADLSLRVRGLSVPIDDRNLVIRAARAFSRAAKRPPGVRISLAKRIPIGAGLGGGSSDAAATLLALNYLHGGPLSPRRIASLAADLGSDVPFFLQGGTVLGLGRGEILRPLKDLQPRPVVVVVPDFGISTAEAFRRADGILTPKRGQISIYRFLRKGVRASAAFSPNDLELAVAPIHHRLGALLGRLRATGAVTVAMTGSGSAVFGLYAGEREAARGLRSLRKTLTKEQAWKGRTVGSAEYSARIRVHER